MGSVKTISHNTFPKQSERLGRDINVIFNYDTSKIIKGTVVRDDIEEPYRMIVKLSDGRYVLSTECQYADELSDFGPASQTKS